MNTDIDPRVVVKFDSLMAMKLKTRGFRLPPSTKLASQLSGSNRSRYRGRGVNFEEYRQYQMGDDIRSLDWSVTQRTGEPHIRVYSEEKDQSVILFVDQRSSMFFSSIDTMKSVVAAHISACCAWKVTKNSDRIGALLFNDHEISWYKPQRNSAHVSRILRTLTDMNKGLSSKQRIGSQSGLESGFSRGLAKLTKQKLKGSLVIMVSDFNDLTENDFSQIKWLKQHNDILGVSISDPMEANLEFVDSANISDGELQLPVGPSLNSKLVQYNKDNSLKDERIRQLIQAGGIDVIKLDTSGTHIAQFNQQTSGGGRV
ncbi:DUF58 domain-containing protein [Vibrio sp. ZSDE26]|uniref:DUF58 domain-containing protein n=1 Tax=Vibrio amylolyticus TaxID=2847292 RepID=A0A9X1XHW2_9VIBR|nr:DUF58 domain-containing protein [Vibrio amylolyticus]MCK6263472.1 DUF58 domain-containing protein [Vibrio amylolyticus]